MVHIPLESSLKSRTKFQAALRSFTEKRKKERKHRFQTEGAQTPSCRMVAALRRSPLARG